MSQHRPGARASRRSKRFLFAAALLCAASPARPAAAPDSPLARRYQEGDSLRYHMEATNADRSDTLRYSADVSGFVRRDTLGRFYEDLAWSHLVRNGQPLTFAPGAGVHQRLTLAPEYMIPPDMAHTDPRLVAPVLDLLTFYVDLWLAGKMPLRKPGDTSRVPVRTSNSWADGRHLVLAEDAVDFDLSLTALDPATHTATVLVRHVPPDSVRVRLPAGWMRAPVAGTPNNWVQVARADSGRWVAGVGRETFDVTLTVDLRDGRLRAATMANPVEVLERTCADSTLASCGEPVRYRILRTITLR